MALVNDMSESTVTIRKSELLEAMKKNRTAHQAAYVEAMKGYRVEAIERLTAMLEKAVSGKTIEHSTRLTEPSEHTKEYDRTIKMLEMSTADEIKVSESQFRQFILDEWSWKGAFEGLHQAYSSKVR